MHTHLVFILSFHTLIALSAFVACQSLLFALISIDGHQHNPLVSHVDVRLSYFFVFSMFTPIIILYATHSVMSTAYAHVLRGGWKTWSTLKSMNQLLGWNRDCAWWEYFVWWKWSMAYLYDFVGIAFFSIDNLKDMIVCWDALSIIVLYQMLDYCLESPVS